MIEKIEPKNRIGEICFHQTSKNPITIAKAIMQDPCINIHGPEHHLVDGSALLTAVRNAGVVFDLGEALAEMVKQGEKMPGATCGRWGVCGSVSSVGAAMAILHGTGPLSNDEHYKNHMRFTAMALERMAEIGGPRCCKRNAFLSLQTAAVFLREIYRIPLETEKVVCEFSSRNGQCIKKRCPFYPKGKEASICP